MLFVLFFLCFSYRETVEVEQATGKSEVKPTMKLQVLLPECVFISLIATKMGKFPSGGIFPGHSYVEIIPDQVLIAWK